ncbi:MAG: NADH-quinone oxidoreductase subunit NuoN [Legionella sp.]
MTQILDNLDIALPEIILLTTACLALLSDLFFRNKLKFISYYCSLAGLFLAGLMSYCLLERGTVIAFHGLFIGDCLAQLMKIFICMTVFLSFIYAKEYVVQKGISFGDYYVMGLFSTLGMMVLVSAHSLLTIYLGLELLSLPLYAMVAITRNNSISSEAAMKYFVMGAMASGILLYGMSLLYGATGTLDLTQMASCISEHWQQDRGMLSFALVFIVTGIAFKMAAIPFHMWAPDVYEGAPTSVTLFISAAPKIAAVAMAMRLLLIGLPDFTNQWQQLILLVGLLSAGLGNLLALAQNSIKRLMAYSAISHTGYVLLGILSATDAGYAASLYYVLIYSLMSVAALGLIVLISNSGTEIESISDLRGLNKRSPWLAFMMMITLFSLAGVPPTVGFFTKLFILKALVDAQMTLIAILGLIFAVIGAFYYLRIIKIMYFDNSDRMDPISLPTLTKTIFTLNCLSFVYLGIFPGALFAYCMQAFIR